MKILVTGASGMLGSDLSLRLRGKYEVVGIGRRPAEHLAIPYYPQDLSSLEGTCRIFEKERPDLVFHAAAMTDVDGCEKDRERALKENLGVTKNVVDACNRIRAFLIFFSTDYLFDGTKPGEYDEQDLPHPLNYYGETKFLAEKYIREESFQFVIFRTSWLFGFYGRSFPRTILEKASKVQNFRVVSDQIGRPTYTQDVADAFVKLLSQNERVFHPVNRESFHLANEGTTSWADFAKAVLEMAHYEKAVVEPIHSTELDRPACRPLNSVLSLKKTESLLGIRLRHWREAVKEFIHQLEEKEILKGYGKG
jgi:dTDP-4-dehydrorhamnose reductase